MKSAIRKNLNRFLDFVLPRFCVHCSKKLLTEEYFICTGCHEELKIPDDEFIKSEFNRKFADKNIVSGFSSAFVFEKDGVLQSMIHSLKYNQNFKIGVYLGKLTALELQSKLDLWKPDMLVPVPLHTLKKTERGYNQSFYIANGISSVTGIPVSKSVIKRIRFTQSQTTMNLEERQENISGAFKCVDSKKVSGKKIILVDDVITTGATTNEAAASLLASGAEKIYAVSSAIAEY
ncbi:MAG: ComF family protein [Ignavibacteriales bacterium]|nr:MAG: ComF family protein [Ignavibacteriales bacterium]